MVSVQAFTVHDRDQTGCMRVSPGPRVDPHEFTNASVTSNHCPRTIFITRTISCPLQGRVKRPQEFYVGAVHHVLVITSSYGPVRTSWHDCTLMVWSNHSHDSTVTPWDARTGVVRATNWNLQCFSYPIWDPYRARASWRQPLRELTQPELAKSRTGVVFSRTGCLQFQNPYGARKLIMHAIKLYVRAHTERQNSYGAARGPCGPRGWTYDFCSKQPVNGAREWDVTGA